jgi:uncharacterized protein YjdB
MIRHLFLLMMLAGIFSAGMRAQQVKSPYISKVYDYMPAPGQFVNGMPEYETGDTKADMIRKAEEAIANDERGMISLGGYGGYVVFGFDHAVQNVPGKYDFRILGNAIYASENPNHEASPEGGSSEPGIVMVSRDANSDGIPNDEWYELAGSEYRKPTTIHNYRITYYRPDPNKPLDPDPNDRFINDRTCIRWTAEGHGEGYLARNIYHGQPYYPLWIADETLTFEGTKPADNAVDESGSRSYYVLYAFHWGYADNHPNDDPRSCFNIAWAVDAGGNPVNLPEIHFIKVYTGLNQDCGWIGETSTEIAGAEDLHLTGRDADVPVFVDNVALDRTELTMQPGETRPLAATITPANATNRAITWRSIDDAIATVDAAGTTGTVTARAEGTTVIHAISVDGYHIATCRVTVASRPATVAVTGVRLNHAALELYPGDRATLTATVNPPDATNKAVRWMSSDSRVAEITVNGLLIADAPGTAIITATTDDGGFRDECAVTVSSPSGTAIVDRDRPEIYFSGGFLYLHRLEGYDCTLYSVTGQALLSFRTSSGAGGRIPCRLPRGLYLLDARRAGSRITVKLINN